MLEIIRNAKVSVEFITSNLNVALKIIINEKYEHQFKPKDRESKSIFSTDKGTLEAMFSGGTYVFYNGVMVDYRMSDSKTFIHSDKAIQELSERVGIKHFSNSVHSNSVAGLFDQSRSSRNNGVFLGGEYSKFDLDIKELGIGGDFNNSIIYKWSPFSSNITTSLEVKRLVCENGMVANSPFVTYEVPVINDWEQSLKIVSTRLETKISDVLKMRFSQMANPHSRSSVSDLQKAFTLLENRYDTTQLENHEQFRLGALIDAINPDKHLSHIYSENVFSDTKLSCMADGHLTQFDLYNVLTEASTHYGRDEDNDIHIQNHLNRIVFDRFRQGDTLKPKIPDLGNSDHKRAFFGLK